MTDFEKKELISLLKNQEKAIYENNSKLMKMVEENEKMLKSVHELMDIIQRGDIAMLQGTQN